MKNSIKKLLLGGAAVLALGIGQDALAQATDSDSITTEAVVVAGVDVVGVNELDFGSFVPDAGGDTITIDTAGTRSVGGTSFLVTSDPGQVGTFTIDADQDTAFNLLATPSTLTGPGTAMTISAVSVSGGDGTTTTSADITGSAVSGFSTTATGTPETFSIGGSLVVGASQAAGTYNGTLTLTATYE